MDLYFKRHDGQAVTCDDFLAAMADANGQDLSTVGRWWVSLQTCCKLSLLCTYYHADPTFNLYTMQCFVSCAAVLSYVPLHPKQCCLMLQS